MNQATTILTRSDTRLVLGTNTVYVGEVVMFHLADQLVGPRLHIEGFAPLGRLGSPSVYCRTTDRFNAPRISYAQWLEQNVADGFISRHK